MASFRQNIIVKGVVTGSYVNGIYTHDVAGPDLTIKATVCPAEGEDLRVLPEGERSASAFLLITEYRLCSTEVGEQRADRVEIYGDIYKVKHVSYWGNGVQSHYEVLVVREEQ